MKTQLGLRYRDTITGLAGVAVARIEYLHGSPQTQLEWVSKGSAPGEQPTEIQNMWFQDDRLREAPQQ